MTSSRILDERQLGLMLQTEYGLTGQLSRLPGGMDNNNLLLTTPQRRLVVRQYLLSGADEVEQEIHLIKNLNQLSFPTPRLLRNKENRLMTLVDGVPHAVFEYIDAARPAGTADLEAVASLAHRLHVLTWQFPGPRERRRFVGLFERFEAYCRAFEPRPDLQAMLDFLRRWRRSLEPELEKLAPMLRTACVHYDLNPGNLLIDVSGQLHLIDFDEFVYGPILLDLCSFLHYWCVSEDGTSFDIDLARRFVGAYSERSALSDAERRALPLLLLLYQSRDCLKFYLAMAEGEPSFQLKDCYSFVGLLTLERLFDSEALDFG